MKDFAFEELNIEGVIAISPFFHNDERGYFIKDFETSVFVDNGIGDIKFNEDFYSKSKIGVVRGLHFQTYRPQAKIVTCMTGRIMDVVVDLRKGSSTFGKYLLYELSEYNHMSLFIPKGCAHGFLTLEDNSITYYKCIGDYIKNNDSTILWNDKELNIAWPLDELGDNPVVISERDKNAMSFSMFCEKYGGLVNG